MVNLKLSPPPYDKDHCCIARCRSRSDFILGPDSSLPTYFKVRCELGICQLHWDVYCAEPPKAASATIKKMATERPRKKAALVRAPDPVVEEEDEFEEDEFEEEEEYEEPPPRKKRKMRLRIRRRR